MTVYIELVVFNNLAVDLLLEVATLVVFRKKIVWGRVVLAAVLGASVATVYPLCPSAWQIVIKVLLAPIMVLIFDRVREKKKKIKSQSIVTRQIERAIAKHKSQEEKKENREKRRGEVVAYFKRLVVFCLATYFVGGVTFGIDFAFGIDVCSYWQFGVVSVSLLTLLITVRVLTKRFSKSARKICEAKVLFSNEVVDFKALCDTGNTLTDSLSGLPVVILSKAAEEELSITGDKIEGYISVKTIGGESELPIVRLGEVDVKGKSFKAYAALSRESYDDFELILQNTMF